MNEIDLAGVRNTPSQIGSSLESRIERFMADHGHTVVLRLADADPYCQAQRAEVSLIHHNEDVVASAVAGLKKRTGVTEIVVACHRGQDIGAFQKHAARIHRVHCAHYPMMSTPCLAARIAGKRGGKRPILTADLQVKGVLVVDIGDLLNMLDPTRRPVISVIQPDRVDNYRIVRGVRIVDLFDAMNLMITSQRVVMGTPLTGEVCAQLNTPVSGDAVSLCKDDDQLNGNLPCCNCGKCVKVCPSRLQPGLLSKHIYVSGFDAAKSLNVHSCIECGCCTFVCPSKRPLVEYMQWGKKGGRSE